VGPGIEAGEQVIVGAHHDERLEAGALREKARQLDVESGRS
jgi:hypothetical protein